MMTSAEWFERAQKVLPGGVNSPVRAFGAVGGQPRFIANAANAFLADVDGKQYLDYVCSWGPLILGHANEDIQKAVQAAVTRGLTFGAPCPDEVKVAERMSEMVPGLEMVRMTNSGTEAVMGALRAARGFTGRDKLIKFDGCYHGHSDAMLVKSGSGALTAGRPDSMGVPAGAAKDTLIAVYNDAKSVARLFDENKDAVAAVIVEPVAANMGVVPPQDYFLKNLRELCDANGALLIFDEVITGFRLAAGGASEVFGVRPDLWTFGKIIGGGMPVGAFGGRRDVMSLVAPLGGVYQAGTLSGNPVAMAAGLAQLDILRGHPEVYAYLSILTKELCQGFQLLAEKHGIALFVSRFGSLFTLFFHAGEVQNAAQARESDRAAYAAFFNGMLKRGFYFAPSQFEAGFMSAAHVREDIQHTLQAADEVFGEMEAASGRGA